MAARNGFSGVIPHSHSLNELLTEALPIDVSFKIYHLSTPPTKCPAIYSAAPNTGPDRTYCESHFLTVTIEHNDAKKGLTEVIIFSIEVLIYTTTSLTTLFVSKADSTGYIH